MWLGNDINLELDEGSPAAARMWSKVMTSVNGGRSNQLPERPESVIRFKGEYYIDGTQRRLYNNNIFRMMPEERDDDQKQVTKSPDRETNDPEDVIVVVCDRSGFAATPYCPNSSEKILDDGAPQANYFCPVHNPDRSTYPVYH